ncbi:hypothetical protein HYZ97_00985 [Candidatus Pacearchaeota archaeon]|nr:hypothetical protein [Candidatus Pacearchaeota archaeon]
MIRIVVLIGSQMLPEVFTDTDLDVVVLDFDGRDHTFKGDQVNFNTPPVVVDAAFVNEAFTEARKWKK